jgi:chemotaxis protein MotB
MPANIHAATVADLDLDALDDAESQHEAHGHVKTPDHAPTPPLGEHPDAAKKSADSHAAHDQHEAESHPHKKHRHKHHEHGGHGDKWLVTYCDMITLLIAFFICILTFASSENGNKSHSRMRDSVIYGPGGSGALGSKGADADSVVWRQVLASVSFYGVGSSSAPSYSDPHMKVNEQVLDMLDHSAKTIFDENFSFRVPLSVFMKDANTFSPAGRRLLGNIAFGLRQFPFDLIIQIEDPDLFPIAFRLSKHLTELAGCPPSRTGISLLDHGTRQRNSVRFMFVARNAMSN